MGPYLFENSYFQGNIGIQKHQILNIVLFLLQLIIKLAVLRSKAIQPLRCFEYGKISTFFAQEAKHSTISGAILAEEANQNDVAIDA